MKKVERWEGAQATLLETQALSWGRSADVGFPDETAEANQPLLSRSSITRGTKTWKTEYWYHDTDFNDYGQPWKVDEDGNFARTTTYTFWSSPSRYIRGRTATENLLAGGVSYRRAFTYDDANGFLKAKTVHGKKVTFQPDPHGNVARQCDGGEVDQNCLGGIGVAYEYAWGVASRADHGEYVETRQINQDGTVDWEERNASAPRPNDGSGYRQSWHYDDLGRVTQAVPRTTPDGGTATITFDNISGETVETRRKNSIVVQELDGYGRVVRTLNAVDVRTSREYDPLGRVVVEDHPYMKAATPFSTLIDYDALGRVVKRRFPDGTQVVRHHGVDANGLLEVTTDEPGRNASEILHTTEKWEASGTPGQARLVALKDARGFWTKYAYNGLGLLVAVCGPGVTEETPCEAATAPRAWTYFTSTDPDGTTVGTDRLQTETHPESGPAEYSYYPSGQLQTRKDAALVTTTFGYDAAGRLKSKTAAGRQTLFEYDVWDNRTVADNGDVRTVWTYHAGTWLVRREDFVNGHDFVTDYPDYDEQDNAREIDYPSGLRIHVNVDQESRVTNVLNQDSGLSYARVENSDGIHPDYHPSGVVARYVLGNGVIQETKFEDPVSRPTHITSGPAGVPYLDLTYGYDPRGNVSAITDPRGGQTQTYGYDENDALSRATGGWGVADYTYDAEGNRGTATRNGNTTEYHYGSRRLQSTTGAAAETFSYDPNGPDGRNGRITGDARGTYSYTTEGLLEQAAMNAGVAIHYTYDADGLRATKTVSGATTYYVHGAAGELLTEFEDNGTVTARDYVYLGSRLVASVRRAAALPPATPPSAPPFPRTPVPPSVPVPADHWKAEYFDNMTLTGTPVSVFDEGQGFINWDWGYGHPAGTADDVFSARWTRAVTFEAGTYRFTVRTDDGSRLYIDNTLVLDKWFGQPPTTYSVDQALTAGTHVLRYEYYEDKGGATAQLSWALAQGTPPPSFPPARWKAEYFDNMTLSGTPVSVVDEGDGFLDHDWGYGHPPETQEDVFSARFTRAVTFSAGTYRFTVRTDDGSRLYIDDQLVLDQWHGQPATTYTVDVSLTPGTHALRYEYYEDKNQAVAQLSWAMLPPPAPIVASVSAAPLTGSPGTLVTITATATGGVAPLQYKFLLYREPAGPWSGVREYEGSATAVWMPGVGDQGSYHARVLVRSAGSSAEWDQLADTTSFTVGPPPPTGWHAEYFDNMALSGSPVYTAEEGTGFIDYQWGYGHPAGTGEDVFSARWTRTVSFGAATYRFTVRTDDGSRLYIDNTLVIDQWRGQPESTYIADVALTAGTHTLRYEYYEDKGTATAHLSWDVAPPPTPTVSATVTPLSATPGATYTITATASGGVAPLQYKFWRYNESTGVWALLRDYDAAATAVWTSSAADTASYHVQVWVRNAGSSSDYDAWTNTPSFGVVIPAATPWHAEYFDSMWLSGNPVYTADEGTGFIDYQWGYGHPPGTGEDVFSARWTRTVFFTSGTYRFWIRTDDGSRLYVDGALVIDEWHGQAATTYSVDLSLAAGNHSLRYEYYEDKGGATAQLWWEALTSPDPDPAAVAMLTPPAPRGGERTELGFVTAAGSILLLVSLVLRRARRRREPGEARRLAAVSAVVLCRVTGRRRPVVAARAAWHTATGVVLAVLATVLTPGVAHGQAVTVEYYSLDALGSVRVVTDERGQILRRHDYQPFGEEYNAVAPQVDKRLFTGQERDADTGLDYFGARYYRADLGRFTTVDPDHVNGNVEDPQSWNAYAYARNNPLRFTDPTGTDYRVHIEGGTDFWFGGDWNAFGKFAGGFTLQGGAFGGTIYNAAGQAVGTYQYFDPFDRVVVDAGWRADAGLKVALLATAPNYALAAAVGAGSLGGGGLTALGLRAAPVAGGALTGLSKGDARAALQGLCTSAAQLSSALRSVAKATTSTTINIVRQGSDVIVQLVRPGANGRQVIESVITPAGNKTVVQKAYDAGGALVHYHPK